MTQNTFIFLSLFINKYINFSLFDFNMENQSFTNTRYT